MTTKEKALHKRLNNEFVKALRAYIEELKISNNLKQNVMNEENLVFLKNQLRNHGFPESIYPDLEKGLRAGQPEFSINLKIQYQNQAMEVFPYFKRGDQGDKYFFNNYKAVLKQAGDIPEDREQKFYINNYKGATLKEAVNLLKEEGPVNKNLFPDNGKGQTPWTALDLTKKTDNGNYKIITYPAFDLAMELSVYPVKELGDNLKAESLVKSLQRGNSQSVTFERPGGDETMLLRVNAKEGTVDLYNKNGEKMNETIKNEMNQEHGHHVGEPGKNETKNSANGQEQNPDKKEELKTGVSQESGKQEHGSKKLNGVVSGEDGKSMNTKTKAEKIKGLLPQKETAGKKKGLSV
jgi:hypothetical protein